ncbi:hypothetical protein BCR37DRAFT_380032 [Protomyces lactucae-debilis]|uniref:Uncharacterized protein n=1 Tax=Protomyces lactucae-debilis TaxID=2754530 RepID=A0A1Y2FH08_PROLT|nr:uncharacterized protein BCR37DRAFT_380032 [Protomyces lactucae-debilis]ORY82095.1 hypothetical protein BCR37DRAFT_380032 [Protomyces lactucae-debilis]
MPSIRHHKAHHLGFPNMHLIRPYQVISNYSQQWRKSLLGNGHRWTVVRSCWMLLAYLLSSL